MPGDASPSGPDRADPGEHQPRWRHAVLYLAFVLVPAAVAILIVRAVPTGAARQTPAPAGIINTLPIYRVLLAIALIVALAHLMAMVADKLGQPKVIGEIIAGLLLGPSVLGAIVPGFTHALWTPEMLRFLGLLAQLGVVFFMFLVGRELLFPLLRGSGGRALVTGQSAIAVPFLAGVALAVTLLAGYRPTTISPVAFVLFCGVALSITAFPVLARVLSDRGLRNTRVGTLGMAAAGVTDVTAWCVLAVVLAVVHGNSATDALRTIGLTVAFGAVIWWGVRPLLARLAARTEPAGAGQGWLMVVLLLVVLGSAAATEAIGVQAIFGGFMAGLVAPRSRAVTEFAYRIEGPTNWFLLPMFFAVTGIHVSLAALGQGANWLVIAVVTAVALAAKLFGAAVPGRLSGLDTRSATGLGVMMGCRGLTELIVLQIGLSLGVFSPDLFVLFLVMALVTTAVTGPLLCWLYPESVLEAAQADAKAEVAASLRPVWSGIDIIRS
ncbi:MAG TPA: cation:proton antiporter [Pseudonocardiaceae bacterium]|nr:cation:proton antiporter [Pseudonocardiaceae bacterium]